MSKVLDSLQKVERFVFDVDGVFTDNSLLVTEEGALLRIMNTRDGLGVKMAIATGFPIAIITGGSSLGVKERLQALGNIDIFLGVGDKKKCWEDLHQKKGWDSTHSAYMGDDLPDIPCLREAGLAVCPADAVEEVKRVADYVMPLKGGHGCVRMLIEQVLKSQDKWNLEAL